MFSRIIRCSSLPVYGLCQIQQICDTSRGRNPFLCLPRKHQLLLLCALVGVLVPLLSVFYLRAAHQFIQVEARVCTSAKDFTHAFASIISGIVLLLVQVGLNPKTFSSQNGGGLSINSYTPTEFSEVDLDSNIFYNNTASSGGGAYLTGATAVTVNNCTCVHA
jgi:hypothetical protein